MRIREFEYTTRDYEAVVDIVNTVWPERTVQPDELMGEDEEYKSKYVRRRFLAEADGQVVGYGVFEHRPNMYHPRHFWMSLAVLPAHRNQGIGGKLYAHMLAILKSEYHARELHTSTPESHDFSIHFLSRSGFQEIKRHVETRLDTAEFDWTPFRGLDEQLAASGIEIRVLSDLLLNDEKTLHKVYALHQMLAQDVPSPAQRTKVDFESWQWGYSSQYLRFIPEANFMALHQGAYIGLSSLWGDPASGKLDTGMTGVKRDHRRKGIATALKLRGIQYAQAHGNLLLITSNKSENPMLQLNLKLGFHPHATEIMYVKKL